VSREQDCQRTLPGIEAPGGPARAGVDPAATVTVTIVEEEAASPGKVMSLEEIWALRAPPFRTAEEIDDSLRRQRDEWDD
jgi:hypothetical protein